jgi:hypothetical protein
MSKCSRKETIELIKEKYPGIYASLEKDVPNLVADPDNACAKDIGLYNATLSFHAGYIFGMHF